MLTRRHWLTLIAGFFTGVAARVLTRPKLEPQSFNVEDLRRGDNTFVVFLGRKTYLMTPTGTYELKTAVRAGRLSRS